MPTAPRPQLQRPFAAAALAVTTFCATGCGGRHIPEVSGHAYQGPALTIDSSGPNHVLVLEAPSGGYTLTIDRVLERSKSWDVFATIRTPDPRFLYTQATVQLRALTPLASTERLRICARTLPADSKDDPAYPVAIPLK